MFVCPPFLSITTSLTVASLLVSGINILETIILLNGTNAPAINKYCIGIPIPTYPINTVADILPIPDTNTNNNSLLVIACKYLLTNIGDSVCPKNMFATATKLSTLLVPNTFCIAPPINETMKFITPK